jgi:hypothetical protein
MCKAGSHLGLVSPSPSREQGGDRSRASPLPAARLAAGVRQRLPGPALPMCRRRWACLPTSPSARTYALRPSPGRLPRRVSIGSRVVSRVQAFLGAPGGRAVWRTGADAVRRAGDRRAAPADPLVDEPTRGIAPGVIENMIGAFGELKREATTNSPRPAEFPLRPGARRLGRDHERRPLRKGHGGRRLCRLRRW